MAEEDWKVAQWRRHAEETAVVRPPELRPASSASLVTLVAAVDEAMSGGRPLACRQMRCRVWLSSCAS